MTGAVLSSIDWSRPLRATPLHPRFCTSPAGYGSEGRRGSQQTNGRRDPERRCPTRNLRQLLQQSHHVKGTWRVMELLLLNLTQFNQHAVYEGGQWAAGGIRSSASDAGHRSAEALISLLGLPGKIRGCKSAACPRLSGVPDALPGGENVHSGLAIARFSGDRVW